MEIKTTTEELRKNKIFFATPCYGGNASGLFTKATNDLATLCAKYGIELRFYYLFNESLIQRARNYCVDEFLRSDCTHMVFVDADIGFDPKDVLSLLTIQTSDPDKYNVVAGPYAKKTIAWEKVKQAVEQGKAENPFHLEHYAADYVFNVANDVTSFKIDEPVEVSETGTGFMLIPRETFVKYKEAYPEYLYTPDHTRTEHFDGTNQIMAYFHCEIDPESNRYLSEDYFFCRKVRNLGMKVWLCPWMQMTHVGSYQYRGSMSAIASLGASPTSSKESNQKHYNQQKIKPRNKPKRK